MNVCSSMKFRSGCRKGVFETVIFQHETWGEKVNGFD